MSKIFCLNFGPLWRHSLREHLVDLADASYTIRAFVKIVSLSLTDDSMEGQVVYPTNYCTIWLADFVHNPSLQLVLDNGAVLMHDFWVTIELLKKALELPSTQAVVVW